MSDETYTYQIRLTTANKNKMLQIAGKLDLSVTDAVNRIIASVDEIETEQIIKFTPKQELKSIPPIIKRRKITIRVNI